LEVLIGVCFRAEYHTQVPEISCKLNGNISCLSHIPHHFLDPLRMPRYISGSNGEWRDGILLFVSLHGSPRLRRVVASQGAYLRLYEPAIDGPEYIIPVVNLFLPTIESIEVIDSTESFVSLLESLLVHQHSFPHLHYVRLWCHRYAAPLIKHEELWGYLKPNKQPGPNPAVAEPDVLQWLKDAGIAVTVCVRQYGTPWMDV
jgi:hypothetical protein